MTTWVWNAADGTVLQRHTGVSDLAVILSSAHSAWGWIGGLDGVRTFLSFVRNPLERNLSQLQLAPELRILPMRCHVFTGSGPRICQINDTDHAFGGDRRTQLIGLTIYALAHEIDGTTATRLFLQYIAPTMLSGVDELIGALRSQLLDDQRIAQIVNEGHVRGLHELFLAAAERLKLPFGDQDWIRNYSLGFEGEEGPDEIHMVGGLLKWLVSNDNKPYHTRSALVARVAAYLKEIGYTIGTIISWNGVGRPPPVLGTKAVILVLGGTSDTDPLMVDPLELNAGSQFLHYQFESVGAMLLAAFQGHAKLLPETLQSEFHEIFDYMQANLEYEYCTGENSSLRVRFRARKSIPDATPIAISLASNHFFSSNTFFAPCYRAIATEGTLLTMRKSGSASIDEGIPPAVARFRAVTASIIVSFFGVLVAPDFEKVRHNTILHLWEPSWIESMAKIVDTAFSEGIAYNIAVAALAVIHAGQDNEGAFECKDRTIGWRDGCYSVLPSVIYNVSPNADCVHLRLIDHFWANVRPLEDGSVESGYTRGTNFDDGLDEIAEEGNPEAALAPREGRPYIAEPTYSPPDIPLYLSFERPLHYGRAALSLVGRIAGKPIGSAGLWDVMFVILHSAERDQEHARKADAQTLLSPGSGSICSIHSANPRTSAMILKASQWAMASTAKPLSQRRHTFVPVQGDRAWALLLAGESTYFNGHIARGCLQCAMEAMGPAREEQPGVLIGFGEAMDSRDL